MRSDKPVAISGIVRRIQNTFNDSYYAGLWESILLDQTLWFMYFEGQKPNSNHYGAGQVLTATLNFMTSSLVVSPQLR